MIRQNETVTEITRKDGRIRRRVQIDCGGATKVEQSHRDHCNINSIMAKARATGVLPVARERMANATYGDFSDNADYQTMMNRVCLAQQQFAALPSEVRKRFHNNPGELINFLQDPKNQKEAYELGLTKTAPQAPPVQPETPSDAALQTPIEG